MGRGVHGERPFPARPRPHLKRSWCPGPAAGSLWAALPPCRPRTGRPGPSSSRSPPHGPPTYSRSKPRAPDPLGLDSGRRHFTQIASRSRATRETANRERRFREVPPQIEEHQ